MPASPWLRWLQARSEDVPDQFRHPLVRWALAALTHRILASSRPQLFGSWSSVVLAEQLADHFAANSFGDGLYAVHVALLLQLEVPAKVQRAAWQTLERERALHLLPPPEACLTQAGEVLLHTNHLPYFPVSLLGLPSLIHQLQMIIASDKAASICLTCSQVGGIRKEAPMTALP